MINVRCKMRPCHHPVGELATLVGCSGQLSETHQKKDAPKWGRGGSNLPPSPPPPPEEVLSNVRPAWLLYSTSNFKLHTHRLHTYTPTIYTLFQAPVHGIHIYIMMRSVIIPPLWWETLEGIKGGSCGISPHQNGTAWRHDQRWFSVCQ